MIRRFFARLLVLVLIAACGYNWLQVQQLQLQVTQLQARQNSVSPKLTIVQRHTPETRLSLSALTLPWKQLQHQANAFRLTSKKVFHEII